jgi:hypothetical protein
MPRTARGLCSAALVLLLPFLLSACALGAAVGFRPPFVPIRFSIDTAGNINLADSQSVTTPLGTFSVEENASQNLKPEDNIYWLTVRHKDGTRIVDTVYQIHTGESLIIKINGSTTLEFANRSCVVDASSGSVTSIIVQSGAGPNTTVGQPPPPPPPPPPDPGVPLSGIGSVSRYNSTYHATIISASQVGSLVRIGFESFGNPDLRNPTESCLRSSDGGQLTIVNTEFTVKEAGHYRGVLTFDSSGRSGPYQFVYSCMSDYTSVTIGGPPQQSKTLPGAGSISRYNATYYAHITSVTRTGDRVDVGFESFGNYDLRPPRSSCLHAGDGNEVQPVNVLLDIDQGGHYKGTLVFDISGRPGPFQFVYSCQNDYTSVSIGA